MATHDWTFTAGSMKPFPKGNFFKIKSASDPLTCTFYNSNGSEIGRADLVQGDAINDPSGFAYVEVISATAQVVEIHTLPFVLSSSNLVGDVNAITEAKNKTLAGNQFALSDGRAGVPDYRSIVALWNPSTESIQINLTRLEASASTPPPSYRVVSEADFLSLGLTADVTGIYEAFGETYNKLSDGANAKARLYGGASNVSLIGAWVAMSKESFDTSRAFSESSPLVLKSGTVVMVSGVTNNISVNAYFEWEEVAA